MNEHENALLSFFSDSKHNCRRYEKQGNQNALITETGVLYGISKCCMDIDLINVAQDEDYRKYMDMYIQFRGQTHANDCDNTTRDAKKEGYALGSNEITPNKCKCMYCGAELDWLHSNNPYDDGLHDIADKYSDDGNVCCSQCNAITSVNRSLKKLIDHPEEFNICLFHIKETIKSLEDNKDKVIKYYSARKANRN